MTGLIHNAFAAATRRRARAAGGGRAAAPPALLELARSGPAPLLAVAPGPRQLRIATVIPPFRRGSGGHATIVQLLHELSSLGHDVSVWLEHDGDRHSDEPASVTRRSFKEFFAADGLELHTDLDAWDGAEVVLATGWQTAARAQLLPGVGARAYLVQDHEPDFYGASAEAQWAAQTYRDGLHCIAASEWLAQLLRTRYGASATHFDLAVDHATYRLARAAAGGPDRVAFYARAVTPRRAVPLGLLALEELARRRPDVELSLYGEAQPAGARFVHRDLGLLDSRQLAELYSRTTVGIVLSLTNPSLIGLEMMACGLPCVELASESMLATFGRDGPLALADPDPIALCAAVEGLLEDPARRERAAQDGLALMADRTWARAARQVEQGLWTAIAAAGAAARRP